MIDISTKYMGLHLKSPLVISASPLSTKIENIVAMQEAGAGAVVMFSLFEEQIQQESTGYLNVPNQINKGLEGPENHIFDPDTFHVGINDYLRLIEQATRMVDMPIIGSLNGISQTGWIDYAKQIESAGAHGLEINIYYIPTSVSEDGKAVEARYLDIVKLLKSSIKIPVAVKLSPYFSSMANMAKSFEVIGTDALVLFNRFYQPDFNIESMKLEHNLALSSPAEIRLPLAWLATLYGQVDLSLAATTGVRSSTEIIKYILAGADCVMTASVLLKHGIQFIKHMLDEVKEWMRVRDFESIIDWQGKMSQSNITDPSQNGRANYIKVLTGYEPITLK